MKWFIGNEAEKTTITFPDVSSFASNAGSDTDDNQNPGCNSPLDNDGGNEVQRPMNFEECWGHDPEIIINENNDSDPFLITRAIPVNWAVSDQVKGLVTPHRRMRLKESTRPQERDER